MVSTLPTSWKTWTTARLVIEVLRDRPTLNSWLSNEDLIPIGKLCDEGHEMKIDATRSELGFNFFHCRESHSDGKDRAVSYTKDTFLEKSEVYPEKVVMIMLLFANNIPLHIAAKELSYLGHVSSRNILDWFTVCHEVISEYMLANQINDGMLGGEGATVEMEFLPFGERKKFSHQIKEGFYVLGFVEHWSKNFRLQLCPEEFDTKSLFHIIRTHVNSGSIVMCDTWAEFSNLKGNKYFEFKKVNYLASSNPKMKDNPAWRRLKRLYIADGIKETEMADLFIKFLFHRKVTLDKIEHFEELLNIFRWAYPVRRRMSKS